LQYEIGEKIGSVLINDNSITQNELNAALQDLDKAKVNRIGDYLVYHQVVNSDDLEAALERQKSIPNLRLGEILMSEDMITESQLDFALKEQKRNVKTPLGELLISKGVISREQLQKSLAQKLGVPFVNLKEFVIDPDILKTIPASLAFRFNVIPLYEFENKLVIAIENPLDWESMESIRFGINRNIDAVMASHEDITWALQFYFSADDIAEIELNLEDQDENQDQTYDLHEFSRVESTEVSENIIVRIVNKIIIDANRQKASDIHIEPGMGDQKVLVRFRKDGTLINYYKFPGKYRSAIVSRIKVMAHLDISIRFIPQDGKIF
jgi:hypothetical protein